jgi:choline dehydrogenase
MADYVVVGAGSAGCVVAARLSEDRKCTVTLIEAGGSHDDFRIRTPGLSGSLWRTRFDWGFSTVSQPGLGGRTPHWPRGKVLGGTSCLNYMVYIRGHRDNYDAWHREGNPGWAYDDVLPFFKKSERNERGADEFHGGDGPLHVESIPNPSRVSALLCEATAEVCGVPLTRDFNGREQAGAGPFQLTCQAGRRCSTAVAFLDPVRDRPNLRVVTGALVERVLFEGSRAVGVRYRAGSRTEDLRAEREVILCAGAVGSPHLLMLSGVGPADHLKRFKIPVVRDLPGVGQNLQDHVFGGVCYEALGGAAPSVTTLNLLRWIARYALGGDGPMTSNFCEAGAFIRTRASEPRPDIEMHFVPTGLSKGGPNTDTKNYVPSGSAFTVLPTLLYPESRGEIRLASAKPGDPPLIDPRYFSERDDLDRILEATRIAREIAHARPMRGAVGKSLTPAADPKAMDDVLRTDTRLRANTVFHPTSTCRMGRDELAVVDHELRVRGIDGLRVHHAEHRGREHERAVHHDRGEGRRARRGRLTEGRLPAPAHRAGLPDPAPVLGHAPLNQGAARGALARSAERDNCVRFWASGCSPSGQRTTIGASGSTDRDTTVANCAAAGFQRDNLSEIEHRTRRSPMFWHQAELPEARHRSIDIKRSFRKLPARSIDVNRRPSAPRPGAGIPASTGARTGRRAGRSRMEQEAERQKIYENCPHGPRRHDGPSRTTPHFGKSFMIMPLHESAFVQNRLVPFAAIEPRVLPSKATSSTIEGLASTENARMWLTAAALSKR